MKLQDVPSGIEAATMGCTRPKFAKSTVHCEKMSWIFDENPRMELDFGKTHKTFKFNVEPSVYDLFDTSTNFKFERTETDTIFTIKITDKNPPSRMSILEQYTKKYLELLTVEKFEVRFNHFQKYDFKNIFIWKITKKFGAILFNPTHEVAFTINEICFLLCDVTAEIFTLPKIKLSTTMKIGDTGNKTIKHERLNFHCEFLPFVNFIKMDCKRVIARTNVVHVSELSGFVRAWSRGKRLLNLKSFIIHFVEAKGELTYDKVLHNIDMEPYDQGTNEQNEGRTIRRKRDGTLATIKLSNDNFSFIVLN